MRDERMTKLAKILVEYSCELKEGQKILIDCSGVPEEMTIELVRAAYAAGGLPIVHLENGRIKRELIDKASDEAMRAWAKYDGFRMSDMQAYIGIRGGNNSLELSDVDPARMQAYASLYSEPVHSDLRVGRTNWVILRWPTEGMSQLAGMSTEAFEDFYFKVCTLDYAKMDRAMDAMAKLMARTDRVRIVGPGETDLSFSIKGIGSQKCAGRCNIPDGEIYTAPVRDSANGVIAYNAPSIENGTEFRDVRLVFESGKIIEATSNRTDASDAIFDTDPGARYVGEFSFGINPHISRPIGDILFDEKIAGSIHFTPGACYKDCDNGNKSAVHWDLVLIQTPEYGGGEIYFDGTLIRKDGRFVLPELFCMNPENLV